MSDMDVNISVIVDACERLQGYYQNKDIEKRKRDFTVILKIFFQWCKENTESFQLRFCRI